MTAYERGVLDALMRAVSYDAARWWAQYLGHQIAQVTSENLIVTSGKELVAKMLMDESGYDTGLTYCAIGTGSITPLASDTTLTTEVERKAITLKSRSSNEVTYSTYFLASEATYNIQEVGLFGHSTATATPDSGVLFNHALLAYDNSSGAVDLTIDVIITFG